MIVEFPVENHEISQKFGNDVSRDPVFSKFYLLFDKKHCGVDFPVSVGTEVISSFPGIVVRVENHSGMGNVISIRNGNIVALYAHLSEIYPDLGEIIITSSPIGLSGDTGSACPAPHLHFELRDISKSSLKEMVFEPSFGKEVIQFKDRFEYVVNNQNTQKNLKTISKIFFGSEMQWELIKQINDFQQDGDSLLEDGKVVIIPNYTDIE